MPYYITQNNPDCENNWGVEKENGDLIGCHDTKELAIDQAIAISIAEETEFVGERAAIGQLKVGDYVSWDPNNPTILAEVVMVQGEMAVVELYEFDDGIFESTEKLMTMNILKLQVVPRPEFMVEKIEDEQEDSPDQETQLDENRAVNLEAPAYMRAAARQGLRYYEEGKAGDGLVDRTVREARAMASGNITADKWVRIAAWIARHLGDLDAPNANPTNDQYPSPGVVAHLLWGSGPSKSSARRALEYAQGVVARLEDENRTLTGAESRNMAKLETRDFDAQIELRELPDGTGMTFSGYAAVFNSASEPLPFIERIAPGAFNRSLKARNDIKLLVNHDTGRVLASSRSGTLRLTEDTKGLRVEADLPDTTDGRDMAVLLKRGDLSAMSFGFSVPANGDTWSSDGSERTLKSIRLHEVSVVAYPAYKASEASVRSFDQVALRTEVDPDKLADAMLKLEEGKDLNEAEASLINTVVQRLTPQPETVDPEKQDDLGYLDVKKKKLEMILKAL
jgi:HK97 family phage prohead protease